MGVYSDFLALRTVRVMPPITPTASPSVRAYITMGRAAHANVLENHTWDAVLARTTPHIREAAANG